MTNAKLQYGENAIIPEGLFVAPGSKDTFSVITFGLIMFVCAVITTYIMNKRKNAILAEAYSTLSIFKKTDSDK